MGDLRLSLLVLDTSPLITLAAAESLDYLLYPSISVIIPDAVFYEATRDAAKLGAQSIIDWVKEHHAQIEIAPTNAYGVYDLARSVNPNLQQRNLGEQAAIEVIEEPGRLQDDEKAILLCEETAILRRIVVRDPARLVEISTMDFLKILEAEQRIQSAEAIFALAMAAGRNASQQEKLVLNDQELRQAVHEVLRKKSDE
jgi:hypothetical protein